MPNERLEAAARWWILAAVVVIASLFFSGRARGDEPSRTLAVLESFPRHKTDLDEPDDTRAERLAEIAAAIDASTSDRLERASLVVMAHRESHLARFVDLDWPRCREGHSGWCDRGRAWSQWQLHQTDRTGSRAWAAAEALRRFRAARNHCNGSLTGAFALYGTGRTCYTEESAGRADDARKLARKL